MGEVYFTFRDLSLAYLPIDIFFRHGTIAGNEMKPTSSREELE
jgi:hypothetical protein